jgi:hypothetical protein
MQSLKMNHKPLIRFIKFSSYLQTPQISLWIVHGKNIHGWHKNNKWRTMFSFQIFFNKLNSKHVKNDSIINDNLLLKLV